MMLFGMIWAMLAPASLLLMAALLAWLLRRARLRGALPIAVMAVLAPVAAIWWWDRADFIGVCSGEGLPVVYRHARADGIFLNSDTANSFGMRYLQEEGFAWVEAPSIYKRGGWVRYARGANGLISSTEIPVLGAQYEVREDFSRPYGHSGLAQTRVIERGSGALLAKAGSVHFDGGSMKWLLGAWGMQSCPGAPGSPEAFAGYYHLAKNALR